MSRGCTYRQLPSSRRTLRDYDIDFSEWFPVGDIVTTADVTVDKVGLTVTHSTAPVREGLGPRWSRRHNLQDHRRGRDKRPGRAKEVELKVRIKDY